MRKQLQRNRQAFTTPAEAMPVFGTIAARFNDDGVTALYQALAEHLAGKGLKLRPGALPTVAERVSSGNNVVVPAQRQRYLAEIAESVRGYHAFAAEQSRLARERQQLVAAKGMLSSPPEELDLLIEKKNSALDAEARRLLDTWPATAKAYSGDEHVVKARGKNGDELRRTALRSTRRLS